MPSKTGPSALVVSACIVAALTAAERIPHVLMISIDGLMASSYTSVTPSKIPAIRSLMAGGVYADGVIGVLPTVTYPSHTTLITGVPTAVHGISDNRMFDPENKSGGASYWYARDIRVPTILGAVHGRGWRTGAVAWPVTVGMDVDFHVPEFWRTSYGADHPESLSFLRVASTPHLLDAVEIARGRPFVNRQTDEERTDIAAFILKTYQPHLTLVHLVDLDGSQHAYGPGSKEAIDTLERLDGLIAKLVDASRVVDTDVVVVSDHGFLPVEHQLNPNALFLREGLITVSAAKQITEWKAVYHASGGSGFVYLKDPSDRAVRDRVWALLQQLKRDPANGVESVWSSEDLARLAGPPDAVFGLDMRDAFYSGNGHETLVTDTRTGGRGTHGGHGFSPARTALHSSFIARGPSVAARGSIGIIRMTQIAPTLARWLGVGLSPQADAPIAALVKPAVSSWQSQGR